MTMEEKLAKAKSRAWFYEFALPDGTRTTPDIPEEVRQIHTSRLAKLRNVIAQNIPDSSQLTAVDFSSHEGFFSLELSKHFKTVKGLDYNAESIDASNLMRDLQGADNVSFEASDLTRQPYDDRLAADFVLVFGLLYHLENPIHVIRLATQLAREHLLIETQIFPYDVSGRLEDGHHKWQRSVEGVFSLSVDYADRREGGSTDIALVPSLNALTFLLENFGFAHVEVLPPLVDDYEQFTRGSRVVIYARRHLAST